MSLQECTLKETISKNYDNNIDIKTPLLIQNHVNVHSILEVIWNSKIFKNNKQYFLYATYGTFTILNKNEIDEYNAPTNPYLFDIQEQLKDKTIFAVAQCPDSNEHKSYLLIKNNTFEIYVLSFSHHHVIPILLVKSINDLLV